MGFPRYHYNKIHLAPSFCAIEIEEHENKNGEFVTEPTDQNKKLPDVEMFNLKNMLDAGVDLEEVNSKIISTKSIDAGKVVRKYTKKSQPSNTEE